MAVGQRTLYSVLRTISLKGVIPRAVIYDPVTGNLYGLAFAGGSNGCGTAFALSPVVGGGWNFNVIHTFVAGFDGEIPVATLTLDSLGNLYGTTTGGGSYNDGTVFKLTPGADGWTASVLYNFTGGDNGFSASGGVTLDRKGNLYGTSTYGGADDVGTVIKLTPTKGDWNVHVIHTFTGGFDGGTPAGYKLAIDAAGNLYGTTAYGGLYGYGTAYKLSPTSSGVWNESVLHAFVNKSDGADPQGGLVFNSAGNLFGTAYAGGSDGDGTVFEIKP
jgi:uncharacterized repeat protein (TIGR03803 family)